MAKKQSLPAEDKTSSSKKRLRPLGLKFLAILERGILRVFRRPSRRDTISTRSHYIEQSLNFLDWVDELGLERTWIGSVLAHLEQQFSLKRLSYLFLFSFALSLLLVSDFDLKTDAQIGQVMHRDVKSPVAFELVDDIATEQKRIDAERAVTPVFEQNRGPLDVLYARIYSAFRFGREILRTQQLSKNEFERFDQLKKLMVRRTEFQSILTRPVSEQTFEWLIEKNFNSKIEAALTEELDRWQTLKVVENLGEQIAEGVQTVTIREALSNGKTHEVNIPAAELKDLRDSEGNGLHTVAVKKGFQRGDLRNFETLVKSVLIPTVVSNKSETLERQKRARTEVTPITHTIKKGQTIIGDGMTVQSIHRTLLNEIDRLHSDRNRKFTALISALLFTVIGMVFFSYLKRFTLNRVSVSEKDLAIMGSVTIFVAAMTKGFLFLTNTAITSQFGSLVPEAAILYSTPITVGSMLVGLLIVSGEVVWLFSLFLAIVLGVMVDFKLQFMMVAAIGGIAAARGVFTFKRRNDIYWAGTRTGIVNAIIIFLMTLITAHSRDEFFQSAIYAVPAGLMSGILASLLAAAVVPIFETVFNVVTDLRLMELSNLNHPLLKEMIVKAPGTYHHSLVVGSMVEAAAEEIGANPLLARVMSYYHDIGKIEHSQYFIENQKPGQNPHDHLNPNMSKTILIAHVKDGIELALKHKLGKPIIDGIVQHHGTTLISYFYNRALEKQDEAIDTIHTEDYRYPGPKPQFREAALIMLADSIEAASRSLDEPTPMRLQNIVKNIIQRKFMDGQLEECNLTLKDLSLIEESFIRVLIGIYHQRIDYPKRAGGGASEKATSSFTGRGNA